MTSLVLFLKVGEKGGHDATQMRAHHAAAPSTQVQSIEDVDFNYISDVFSISSITYERNGQIVDKAEEVDRKSVV